jgi:hypothetical protein
LCSPGREVLRRVGHIACNQHVQRPRNLAVPFADRVLIHQRGRRRRMSQSVHQLFGGCSGGRGADDLVAEPPIMYTGSAPLPGRVEKIPGT